MYKYVIVLSFAGAICGCATNQDNKPKTAAACEPADTPATGTILTKSKECPVD